MSKQPFSVTPKPCRKQQFNSATTRGVSLLLQLELRERVHARGEFLEQILEGLERGSDGLRLVADRDEHSERGEFVNEACLHDGGWC